MPTWLQADILIVLGTDLAELEGGAHLAVDLVLFLAHLRGGVGCCVCAEGAYRGSGVVACVLSVQGEWGVVCVLSVQGEWGGCVCAECVCVPRCALLV